jgi:hypothetical protein
LNYESNDNSEHNFGGSRSNIADAVRQTEDDEERELGIALHSQREALGTGAESRDLRVSFDDILIKKGERSGFNQSNNV